MLSECNRQSLRLGKYLMSDCHFLTNSFGSGGFTNRPWIFCTTVFFSPNIEAEFWYDSRQCKHSTRRLACLAPTCIDFAKASDNDGLPLVATQEPAGPESFAPGSSEQYDSVMCASGGYTIFTYRTCLHKYSLANLTLIRLVALCPCQGCVCQDHPSYKPPTLSGGRARRNNPMTARDQDQILVYSTCGALTPSFLSAPAG